MIHGHRYGSQQIFWDVQALQLTGDFWKLNTAQATRLQQPQDSTEADIDEKLLNKERLFIVGGLVAPCMRNAVSMADHVL